MDINICCVLVICVCLVPDAAHHTEHAVAEVNREFPVAVLQVKERAESVCYLEVRGPAGDTSLAELVHAGPHEPLFDRVQVVHAAEMQEGCRPAQAHCGFGVGGGHELASAGLAGRLVPLYRAHSPAAHPAAVSSSSALSSTR